MTDSSLVSVIIRTKNRPQLLHEALASVLGQSYSPVEILVVNDGGEDIASGLPDISPETGKSISYHNLQPGKGRSAAANTGLENATGEYCIFLDDDDWFDPDHIGNLVNALQDKPGYLAAYSCVQAVSKQEKPGRRFDYPFDPVRLLLENYIPIHAVLFSRTLVEKGCRFDLQFDRMEDWDFWLQAARWTSFYFIRQCTAHYRIDSDSGFGAKDEENTTDTRLAVYRKWLGHWRDEQLLDLLNRAREFPRLGILENEKRELKDSLLTREAQIDNLGNLLMEAQDRASRQALEIRDLHALVNNQQALMNNQQAQINSLHHEMQIVYNSRSWRLTKPLRDLNRARQIRKSKGTWALLNKIRQKLFMPASRLPKLGSGHDIAHSYQPLSFSPSKAPMVSIVIPVYNKHLYTFHCLQAVLQNTGADIDFDVIVVDDRSDDETGQMLEQMKGITVLRNEK
ncbi:MAG: glycosyltransferase, partial [Pseudohongiellaceae bacterium]